MIIKIQKEWSSVVEMKRTTSLRKGDDGFGSAFFIRILFSLKIKNNNDNFNKNKNTLLR